MLFYRGVRSLLRGLFRVMYRLEAHDMENIPREGPVILCGNHTSNWDPPIMGVCLKRKIHYMAKAELFKIPLFGPLIRSLGAFPVKRGGVSKESIKLAIQLLRGGHMMGIFPEGSRSNAGGMGKKGAASLAVRSGATVIPVAIVGKYKLFGKVDVFYGKPVDLAPYADGSAEQLEAATEEIMRTIRSMVDQKSKNLAN